MRNISLDLIRVTEAAAISASKWVGSGNKELADKAATDAMRSRLNRIPMDGTIIIGEGEKDESYGLFSGEKVGLNTEKSIAYDIAVDPIEGTNPTITSGPEAISTIAVSKSGCMHNTSYFYTKKLAYGPKIKSKVILSLSDPLERIIELTAQAIDKEFDEIMVCILDRPRHDEDIKLLRKLGVRIKLIKDCDVSGAVATCLRESGVDLLYGIGGAPEAVLSACAIKCLGGDFQCQDVDKENNWNSASPVLGIDDLIKGPCVFVATGITNGSILRGVRWTSHGPVTNSVFMRSESGTVRWLEANHGN
jgi:fructose-1,6-bisphosphatase II